MKAIINFFTFKKEMEVEDPPQKSLLFTFPNMFVAYNKEESPDILFIRFKLDKIDDKGKAHYIFDSWDKNF